MKIIIPGGTGQVGTLLARALHTQGHCVTVLGRDPKPVPWTTQAWDGRTLGRTLGAWAAEIDGADVVINLAGRSVNCRYTPRNRREILESRVNSTRVVGEAIARAAHPPRVWLQMSTATIYAHRYDAPNDELTGILSGNEIDAPDTWRFSIDVAQAWERTVNEAFTPRTRKILLRSAMVMSADRGGVFDMLLCLARCGLGGPVAGGRQFMSWIHARDFVHAMQWLIDDDSLCGPVNLASPNPLPQAEFMRALRDAAGVRFGLPATRWMFEIGALALGTETELILKSRRVVPGRLVERGFTFDFPEWPMAARQLCAAGHAR